MLEEDVLKQARRDAVDQGKTLSSYFESLIRGASMSGEERVALMQAHWAEIDRMQIKASAKRPTREELHER